MPASSSRTMLTCGGISHLEQRVHARAQVEQRPDALFMREQLGWRTPYQGGLGAGRGFPGPTRKCGMAGSRRGAPRHRDRGGQARECKGSSSAEQRGKRNGGKQTARKDPRPTASNGPAEPPPTPSSPDQPRTPGRGHHQVAARQQQRAGSSSTIGPSTKPSYRTPASSARRQSPERQHFPDLEQAVLSAEYAHRDWKGRREQITVRHRSSFTQTPINGTLNTISSTLPTQKLAISPRRCPDAR